MIQPYDGTVTLYGVVVDIQGYRDLEWAFQQQGEEKVMTTRTTRFYIPKTSEPFFDATFSQSTARKYGIS